jgi:hypothetical protein
MGINKLKVLSLTLVLILLIVPGVFAQETDDFENIDFSEYDLGELTEEQIENLKTELSELYDSLDEVDRKAILSALENLEIEDGEDVEIDNLGEELSAKIHEFKNDPENEEWTGQNISGMIQGFLDEKIENRNKNKVEVQNQEQNNNQNQVAQENKNNAQNKDKDKGKAKGK